MTRERVAHAECRKNYEILLLATLTSVLTRTSNARTGVPPLGQNPHWTEQTSSQMPMVCRAGGGGWDWLGDNRTKLTLLLTLQIRGMVLLASLTLRIPNKYIVLKHMIHPNTMILLNIGADRRINLERRPTFVLGRHNCEEKPVNISWYSLLLIFVSVKGEKKFAHDLRNGINYEIRIWVGVTCSIN